MNNESKDPLAVASLYALAIDGSCRDAQLERLLAGAPVERRERAARFRREDDKKRCVLSEALVRYLAVTQAGADPAEVRYAYGDKGKPRFKDMPGWQFNASHSGRWVFAGWGRQRIGVDVEQMGNASAPLAKRAFHPAEARFFEASGDPAVFYRLWTLKESYIKYLGLGLSMPLGAFYFTLDGANASLNLESAGLSALEGSGLLALEGISLSSLEGSGEPPARAAAPYFFEPFIDEKHRAAVCTDAASVSDVNAVTVDDLCAALS